VASVSSNVYMCMCARAVARTVHGNSDSFVVKVGMHQGFELSPLLFVVVMKDVSR